MDNQEGKILRGTAGSPGVAEGIVKVVEGIQDIERFNDGDVLVTKMTEPEMVIMMNKAVAIVTDTGGITGHAAIVSRELGIPCVVATKTATKELKDGLKVRVDGDKGEVEILSD
jgi:pyruvate,water dikinase